ncbi:MAG: hypothetical protein HC915_07435 [Anaerolineae bacterium]|nr:hypothetical protein [Anaerolineae bacterium]
MFKVARARFSVFNQILIDVQAWGFSQVFYYTIMVPFGLGVRLLGDPLSLKNGAHWREREPVGTTLEDAQRQG